MRHQHLSLLENYHYHTCNPKSDKEGLKSDNGGRNLTRGIELSQHRTHARTHTRARTSTHGRGGRRVHKVAAKRGSLVERVLRGDTIRLTLSLPLSNSSGNDIIGER